MTYESSNGTKVTRGSSQPRLAQFVRSLRFERDAGAPERRIVGGADRFGETDARAIPLCDHPRIHQQATVARTRGRRI